MVNKSKTLSKAEKQNYIKLLTNELPILRTKAGIQQEELSNTIGISRQTYGAIERGDKEMSWVTYIALLFFFDQNRQTHHLLRKLDIFPHGYIEYINNGQPDDQDSFLPDYPFHQMLDNLDDQGLHAVQTVLCMEYARCKEMSGEEVIKSFDGRVFHPVITDEDRTVAKAIQDIKKKKLSENNT